VSEPEKYLYMQDVPPLLKEQMGIRMSLASVEKKFSPKVGQGPKPAAYWGNRPVYRPADVLEWAKARLTQTRA
jgi:hypothetical protein